MTRAPDEFVVDIRAPERCTLRDVLFWGFVGDGQENYAEALQAVILQGDC